MLSYAASRRPAQRRPSPQAMLFILAGHITAIALVMSAKMELPRPVVPVPTIVEFLDPPKPPPPERDDSKPVKPAQSAIDDPPVIVPVPQPGDPVDARPIPLPLPGNPVIGPDIALQPVIEPRLQPLPVRLGPRLLTSGEQLRPPYPAAKIASEEEAVLRLRLTIDERGRVVAVDPVGRTDPAFLEAARRHLIARWRYQPASEGGRALASATVITLRFQLDD